MTYYLCPCRDVLKKCLETVPSSLMIFFLIIFLSSLPRLRAALQSEFQMQKYQINSLSTHDLPKYEADMFDDGEKCFTVVFYVTG